MSIFYLPMSARVLMFVQYMVDQVVFSHRYSVEGNDMLRTPK